MSRTPYSPLRAAATADEIERLVDYAVRHAKRMTPDLIKGDPNRAGQLVRYYVRLCGPVGLDPVLTVAQSWHETDMWAAWWYRSPRRNPAGIGVNGWSSPPHDRRPGEQWQQSRTPGVLVRGHAFPTYATATMSHVHGLALWAGSPGGAIRDLAVKCRANGVDPYTPPQKAWRSAANPLELGHDYNPNRIGWADPGREKEHPKGTPITAVQALALGKTYGHGIARHATNAIG